MIRSLPLLLLLLFLIGCAEKKTKQATALWFKAPASGLPWQTTKLKKSDKVLARVNGVPITESQLKRIGKQNPGVNRNLLFNRLVEMELLAQQAMKAGLFESADIQRAGRLMAVRLFLKHRFEIDLTTRDIPTSYIRMAYHYQRRRYYQHPDGFTMLFYTIACCKKTSDEVTRKFAWHLYETHGHRLWTRGDFAAVVDFYRLLPFKITFNRTAAWYDFSLKDQDKATYTQYAKNFRNAFIKLKPGELSKPVKTRFGYHIIRLINHFPARNVKLEQVEQEVRDSIFPAFRALTLKVFFKDLKGLHETKLYPERLKLLEKQ